MLSSWNLHSDGGKHIPASISTLALRSKQSCASDKLGELVFLSVNVTSLCSSHGNGIFSILQINIQEKLRHKWSTVSGPTSADDTLDYIQYIQLTNLILSYSSRFAALLHPAPHFYAVSHRVTSVCFDAALPVLVFPCIHMKEQKGPKTWTSITASGKFLWL